MKTLQQRYRERLEAKRGSDFIACMDRLANPYENITMTQVAQNHHLTRERIRQIFLKLHGYPFTASKNSRSEKKKSRAQHNMTVRKLEKRKLDNRIKRYKPCGKHHTGLVAEITFRDECKKRGLVVYEHPGRCACDFIVNSQHVEVKSCLEARMPSPNSKTPVYIVSLRRTQYESMHFVAVYAFPEACFFIIPKSALGTPKGNKYVGVCIPAGTSTYHYFKGKYLEFKDAWHLLNTPPTDVPVSDSGDSLTRTTELGNGDDAPDTDRLVAQVEAAQTSGETAQEPPSRLAEMR